MNKTVTTLACVLVIATSVLAQEVDIDHDRWARFTALKTFAWMDGPQSTLADTAMVMHERIKTAIINQLSSGRLKMAEADPDLYVTYCAEASEELRLSPVSLGYRYPGGW